MQRRVFLIGPNACGKSNLLDVFRFLIAVRKIEAWLLADRENLARFLAVPVTRLPLDPEGARNSKLTMVELARGSRRREIREDMAPRPGSGRAVGGVNV